MAEAEPEETKNDFKEEPEQLDEAVGTLEARVCLNNVTGTVFRAHRFGIYATFEHEGKSEIGVLFPGKSFANASSLLGDVVKTDQELALLFPPGMTVWMDMVSQVSRLVPESGSNLGTRTESGDKGEERKCGWVIMLLWIGGLDKKPDRESLNNGTVFADQELSFANRLLWIISEVMQEDSDPEKSLNNDDTWFITTIIMPKPNTAMSHPDMATSSGVEGTVTAIHRPHGGVIDCGATQVFFHRSRVYLEGVHLSVTLDLEQVLTPGMKVMVDYGPNEKEDGPIFEDCPTANVALLVYTGQRPRVSDLRHKPFPLAEDENSKYLVAKIVKFDPPGPTGVESGIAEILKPTDLNTLAFTKNSFKRYVDVDSPIKYVRFHREKMFHLGALQHKADLQYFFSSCAFGMNIFYCYAAPVQGARNSAKVLFRDVEITHEVCLGWKGSVSFLHATGQGGLTLTPNTREDTLLYPRVFSFQSTKFLGREGMDIKTYEVCGECDA